MSIPMDNLRAVLAYLATVGEWIAIADVCIEAMRFEQEPNANTEPNTQP